MQNNKIRVSRKVEASIIFKDGMVSRCYYYSENEGRAASSSSKNYNEVLRKAMTILAQQNPEEFLKMYRELKMDSREYKIAKEVKNKEIARLKSIWKEL